jgi:integrase
MLAVATGARNGELCGLEWIDLDLDAGTIRFRQALTNIAPAVLPEEIPGADERREELAVGPVKSAASNAILTLPPSPCRLYAITAASRPASASPSASLPP